MPTELTMTTRMPPVKPGSGVRPITDPAESPEPPFDRRPTAPFRRDEELVFAADGGDVRPPTFAYAPRAESQNAQPAQPAAASDRHTPAIPTYGPLASQHATAAADYAVYEFHEAVDDRETAQRVHAAHSGGAAHAPPSDAITQMRLQLAAAVDNARKHEQRAMEAELRASWAERFMPQLQDPELVQRAQRRQRRMRWLKRVLEISCVGLALGGYISLLVPVRERVIAQNAMIHQLTTLQAQLRDEKRALLQRIESLQAPSEAEAHP